MTNPLLEKSSHPYQSVPFQEIQSDHFLPALEEAITQAKKEIKAIAENPEKANFKNTIVALETSGQLVEHVSHVYFNLFSAEANEAHQKLAEVISPKLSAFSNDILLDQKLFDRVKAVYETRQDLELNVEEKRLLEKSYRDFARNGALLDQSQKDRLRKIDEELSELSPRFAENVLKETNAFQLVLKEKEELVGLPELAKQSAREAAKERNIEGYLFTLDAPSYIPLMTYSENQEAREKVWRAYNSCASQGKCDNREVLKKMARLRHQRAQLLGYSSHAHFVLEERMAETPEKVKSFMDRLFEVSKKAAIKEFRELEDFKEELSGDRQLNPWDVAFYSEKLKEKKYQFKAEELRPYFCLENVIDGAFAHAEKLYQITFEETPEIPKYHPDVKVYRVKSSTDNRFVGLFYADFFPRSTKKNGAWMTNYLEQGLHDGETKRPHVSIVCNFSKPTKETPSLLTLDEVRTLFHEFGHALHSLLSNCTYSSLSGTNVYWDFVELPSQINENWILEKQTLDHFAKHYQNGELISQELTEKMKKASQFQAGLLCLRQLSFAFLDFAYHSQDPTVIDDVESFEAETLKDLRLLPHIPGTLLSTRFSHIFSGGYSAGYYSYKWAEVLDADAFELFKEKGLYNPEVAKSFRENILEKGGTEHPMELYKRFRGREPDPDALLRRDCLI